jgi:hypothetical protein
MLTARLGGTPSASWKKGDMFGTKKPRPQRTGGWLLKAEGREPGDLDSQIAEIFSKLTSDLSIWRDLAARYKPNLFVGLFLNEWNEGIDVSCKSLALLTERGVLLGLDVYGPRQ